MPRRKTTTKPTAVESSELAVSENNESQLSVFDYQDIAQRYSPETASQLESLAHEGTGILVDAKIKFGDVLRRGKALVEHGDFEKWHKAVWGVSSQRASDFMNIALAKMISPESGDLFPENLRPASTMAKAILKAPEESRQELVSELKAKKESQSKDLTEAQIKELAKPYLEQLQKEKDQLALDLEKERVRVDNTKGYYQSQLDSQEKKLTEAKEALANQNKHIQELNSAISAKENQLKAIADKEEELDQELNALQESKANLEDIIDQTVQDKLAEEKAKALAEIEKQKEVLKTQEKELKAELKKQQAILGELDKQKKAFVKGSEWLQKIENFNNLFTERALGINVISTLEDLTSLPDFNNLADEEKEIFARQFNSNLQIFLKNKEAWSNAVNQIELILNQMRLELNISDSKAVDVEVLNG